MTTKALITGHTRGLGAAIARTLLARGIPTLGMARGATASGRADACLLEEHALDLSDTDALANWLAGQALDTFLAGCRTIVLINNAGLLQPVGPLETHDPAVVARAVGVNVAAPLMLAAAVGAIQARVTPRPAVRIAHISSGAGRHAYPGWSLYCATKAALDHHARAVALDQTPELRISSVAPGVIDTDMQAEIRASDVASFPMRERFEALKRDGGLSSPEDCAQRLVAHLLGDGFGAQAVEDLRPVA
jgi:benzil reductase ((S)-benzoin forming)